MAEAEATQFCFRRPCWNHYCSSAHQCQKTLLPWSPDDPALSCSIPCNSSGQAAGRTPPPVTQEKAVTDRQKATLMWGWSSVRLVIGPYGRLVIGGIGRHISMQGCNWWNCNQSASMLHFSSDYVSHLFTTLFRLVWEASRLRTTPCTATLSLNQGCSQMLTCGLYHR
jgi:hypothetical protein